MCEAHANLFCFQTQLNITTEPGTIESEESNPLFRTQSPQIPLASRKVLFLCLHGVWDRYYRHQDRYTAIHTHSSLHRGRSRRLQITLS